MNIPLPPVAAIAIGRNEGQRLLDCLASLTGQVAPIVYVDSGSTDGSVDAARALGVDVVELDMTQPFTAARARNAGYERVKELAPDIELVQLLDSDCELADGWIDAGRTALLDDPKLAVVCGRRREKFPDATIWNQMTDDEWDSPIGPARYCGGDAMMRRAALDQVGGYREDLIAGEEPEMCYRMRENGWGIYRLDAEMTRHDAAMTKISQWWQRSRRAGHTYAEGAAIHGAGPERYRIGERRRTIIWGMAIPAVALIGTLLISPWFLLVLLAWPAQIVRLVLRGTSLRDAFFLTLGKLAEAQGAIGYWKGRMTGKRRKLIEYK